MGQTTSIPWCDATWNPIRGCSMAKGSETGGRLNCYAARLSARNLPQLRSPTTGENFARILPSGPRWTGKVELIESALMLPLHWSKPRKIFVNSMSDLFHEALPDKAIDRIFVVMALCPQHMFQVLTKRADRMREYFRDRAVPGGNPNNNIYGRWLRYGNILRRRIGFGYDIPISNPGRFPLRNVWLGVSVENQATADERIPLLLQTPAKKRFISYEPALSAVDFARLFATLGIDQLIIGGESGPGSRPFDIQWARDTIAQCKAAGVACFVKQLGARPYAMVQPDGYEKPYRTEPELADRKGGDMAEWPEDLRVREFPI